MSDRRSIRKVYAGRVLDLHLEEHDLPNGRRATFEIVRHPGGAAVLPVLADGRLLLVRQYRPALGRFVYEIPAGRLDPGETAETCAARELVEETGHEAGRLEPLGGLWSAVGFCDEYIALYLAEDLRSVAQQLEPDEIIELRPMTIEQALHALEEGTILDAKTQVALLRYVRLRHGGGA